MSCQPPLPGAKPVVVEEGDCLQIPIYAIQHDPQYFDHPDTFNFDRFGSDSRRTHNPGTFLTFGQGPRRCIANRFVNIQGKVLLSHLFAKCTLKMCSKTAVPLQFKNTFAMSIMLTTTTNTLQSYLPYILVYDALNTLWLFIINCHAQYSSI